MNSLDVWVQRAHNAERAANEVLASYGEARARVISLRDLLKLVAPLPIDLQDYFTESIRCLEFDLTRASVVLSWAGFFGVLFETGFTEKELEIKQNYPKWDFNAIVSRTETKPEHQILEALCKVKYITKTDERIFKGQLTERNRSAHPSYYKPQMNAAIGYVETMIRQTTSFI